MENPRKKKAQMKTIVRAGSPEENRIRLNKREKTEVRKRKNIKTEEWRSRLKKRGKSPRSFYTPEIQPFYTPVDIHEHLQTFQRQCKVKTGGYTMSHLSSIITQKQICAKCGHYRDFYPRISLKLIQIPAFQFFSRNLELKNIVDELNYHQLQHLVKFGIVSYSIKNFCRSKQIVYQILQGIINNL